MSEVIDLSALEWGRQMKIRMAAAGITNRALAAEVGITEAYLSGILAEKRGNEGIRDTIEATLQRLVDGKSAERGA